MTLAELSETFEQIAATGNQQRKRDLVQSLFARCAHPREIAYLCKIIFSDLRTGVREGVLQAAVAQAFGLTTAEIQQAQFLIGDLDQVAVLARRDRLADATFTLFHPIQFMLATPKETAQELEQAFADREFWAEDKLDGIRAQVHKQGNGAAARIAIYTRTMDRIDESFPDVIASLRNMAGDFLLDGEIVAYRDGAVQSFAHLQQRLGRKKLTARILKEHPAAFVAFDVLYRDGELLIDRPLRERLKARATLVPSPGGGGDQNGAQRSLILLDHIPVRSAAEISVAFAAARDRLNEGLVLKDPDSTYSPGRRGQMWFKLKTHLPTLDCVVTAAEYGHGKRRGVLSDYTFAVWTEDPVREDARLVNIGKAYSGVTDAEIAQLTELFMSIATATNGRVFQVRPQVVLEIAMDQIQRSNRHESGFALRFPRIKRIRWDKSPLEADRLDRVKEIYATRENITRKEEAKRQEQPGLFDGIV